MGKFPPIRKEERSRRKDTPTRRRRKGQGVDLSAKIPILTFFPKDSLGLIKRGIHKATNPKVRQEKGIQGVVVWDQYSPEMMNKIMMKKRRNWRRERAGGSFE